MSRTVLPKGMSSRKSHSSQQSLGDFSPLWAYLETTSSSPSKDQEGLGDFGSLWRYLEVEKEKWCGAVSPSLEELATVLSTSSLQTRNISHNKQPPLLPHSSSSEYSSEEELLLASHKAKLAPQVKKKRTRAVLKSEKTNDKKTTKKTNVKSKKEKKSKNPSAIPGKSNGNGTKKVHFDDECTQEVSKSPKRKQQSSSTPIVPIPITISPDPIHVFVDNSNILVGFLAYCREQQIARMRAGDLKSVDAANVKPKLDYEALFTILERGRNIDRKVLVASSPLYQRLDEAEKGGYEVSVLRRVKRPSEDEEVISPEVSTGVRPSPPRPSTQTEMEKEQCVDELLHLKILESLLDYSAPATLVLASGDGKDGEYFQGGFHKCVVMALNRGWKVEVISWQRQLSHNFLDKKFLGKWKGRYHVVFLDWFAKELGCDF